MADKKMGDKFGQATGCSDIGLMLDSTKVQLQEKDAQGKTKKVQMRWALASTGEGRKFEIIGIWINKSWENIRRDLDKWVNYRRLEVLFSDGEAGIEENFLDKGMRNQRCIFHGVKDFTYVLYEKGLKGAGQKELKDKLVDISAMSMTKKKLVKIKSEDIPKVKKLIRKSERGFKELIEILDENKYPKARTYIENLSNSVMTFFKVWLEGGKCIPLNTNAVESAFSQVKNRIWAVGKRWGEKGLTNWLKLVVRKVFFLETWGKLLVEYLRLDSSLQFNLLKVSHQWK